MRIFAYVLFFLFVFPAFLIVVYRLPFIHPVSTLMIKDLALIRGYDRQWVYLDDISPNLRYAVMMSEDGQFCSHHGVDWGELKAVVTRDGGPSRGASTITMQMVKNLFLWHDRSYLRKGFEIPYAVFADFILPKDRIMEIYLNIAEWGPGIYGAEAAAQHYFKRSAKNLTPRQAAYLAVTLPNPKLRNPARPTVNLARLARLIENRARRSGAYTQCVR
ncbi:monofunctional biosynthetic peptidoglycan transglycosylase [Bartonella sp. LJL80]